MFCAVLCMTVVHDTHAREQFLKLNVGFRFRFSFCVFFCFSLDYFSCLLAFVVLGLVCSILRQEIGWEERP